MRETLPTVERVESAYDAIATEYDGRLSGPFEKAENRVVGGIIERAWSRVAPGYVIDLGCGTGLVPDLTAIKPELYLGIDLSTAMLNVARAKHPEHEFMRWDMREILDVYGDGSLTSVVSTFGSMNHLQMGEVRDVLFEIGRTLRGGGRAVLMLASERRAEAFAADVPAYGYGARALSYFAESAGLYVDALTGLSWGQQRERSARVAYYRLRLERLARRPLNDADWIILEATKER